MNLGGEKDHRFLLNHIIGEKNSLNLINTISGFLFLREFFNHIIFKYLIKYYLEKSFSDLFVIRCI